jgi:RND family efflux transporter MFP subunit
VPREKAKFHPVNLHAFLVAFVVLPALLLVAMSVFQKLCLGSVIGLIVAGVALGPWVLHIAPHVDRLLNFTELGAILLMFTVGIEMAPKKLWTIRRLVFELGSLQAVITGAFCALALLFAGCSKSGSEASSFGPQEVLVTEVIQRDVPVVREWIGSLDGSVNADIRARVSGYVIAQNYKEGTVVHQGDLLFQIDPSTYEAAVEQAKSAVAQSEANQLQSEQTEKRETQLFEQKVESAQNRDNAVQANVAAKAEVKAQQAALRQAQLNLDFTKITAPVTGIAGIANPGIGDLVGPSDAQPLMTMSTVDPIKAYLKISEQDYLKFARRVEQGSPPGEKAPPAEIILADGTLYPRQGKFSAIDRQVDQQTGTIRLAALFPNPDHILRPGGFVRVRVTVRNLTGAFLVPQRAVNELQTSYEVAVVGAENKVEIRSVKAGDRVGTLWVIEDGIKPGDRVIVEGTQKVRDGQLVKPVPWAPSAILKAQ